MKEFHWGMIVGIGCVCIGVWISRRIKVRINHERYPFGDPPVVGTPVEEMGKRYANVIPKARINKTLEDLNND